jgi:hypothetical protein
MSAKKMFEVALVLSATDKATRTINQMTANAQKRISALSGMGDKAFGFGRSTGAAGLAILAPIGLAINAAEESEVAGKRLNQVFKTMGEVNGNAAKQAADYASKLQMQIGIEDESIMMVQAKIATFKAVSDETARMSGTFDRATQSAFDMAAGGFGEAEQNAVMLGKALQNPALGAMALSKAGALNKSDIPLIKQIQATKGLGAAQEFVLKAVEKQFKGQAANIATNAQKMKVKFSEVSETVGRVLLPQFQKLMEKVGRVADRFQDWASRNPKLLETIVTLGAKTGIFLLAVSGLSFAFGGVFKAISIGMTVMKTYRAIVTTVTAVQTAMAFSALSGATATGTMTAALTAMNLAFLANPITWIILAIVAAVALIYIYWEPLKTFFGNLWGKIKVGFQKFWNFVKEWGVLLLGPIGLIIKYWDNIRGFFMNLWPRIKSIFMKALDYYLSLPKMFLNIGINIVMGIWNGIKSKASALFGFVKDMGKQVANAFKTVLGIASPSKVFMDYGINITEGASKGIQKGSGALKGASAGLAKGINPIGGSGGGSSAISVTFAPVINGGGNSSDVLAQIKAYVPELIKQIEDSLARKNRLAY